MSEVDKLLVLQEIDCGLRDMEKEIKDIPERQERERRRLDTHQKEVAEADQSLRAKQAQLKELELEVQAEQEKIAKLRQQQLEIKTNKEFKAIEHEIAGHNEVITKLEDRELTLMEEAEQLQVSLSRKHKDLEEEKAAVEKDVSDWNSRSAELNTGMEAKKAERAAAVVGIDPEWLACYERIFARKDKALVALKDGHCGGCHMLQPPYVVHDTRKRESMVLCSTCGRMLY